MITHPGRFHRNIGPLEISAKFHRPRASCRRPQREKSQREKSQREKCQNFGQNFVEISDFFRAHFGPKTASGAIATITAALGQKFRAECTSLWCIIINDGPFRDFSHLFTPRSIFRPILENAFWSRNGPGTNCFK